MTVDTARRRALVASLGWLGWRAQAQVTDPAHAAATAHRRLRFDIQLHNPGGTPLPPQPLWFCAPLSRTGAQALLSLDSSWPFERHDEWGGHTLLRWQTPALPPHGLRALTLDAVVGLNRLPRGEALEPGAWLRPERFMESDDPAIAALALTLRRDSPREMVVAVYDWVRSQLDFAGSKPLLHVSARFPAENGNLALVLPLARHPVQSNKVIVCNLMLDPSPLERFDGERLRELLYTPGAELPADTGRVPLKELHLNRSPMLAPAAMLAPDLAARHGIDLAACEANRQRVCAIHGLREKLTAIYREPAERPEADPD